MIGGLVIDGIQINASNNTLVEGNIVGTDPTGSIALPNGTGIGVINGSSNNTIGGTVTGAGNAIVDNSGDGVYVDPNGTQDAILSNVIYNNGGLGIDLASGANNNQAPPTLTSAKYSSGTTTIAGNLSGQQPNTTYTLQFFANQTSAPAGAGQGQTLLGTATVTTDGSGDVTFTLSFTTQDTTDEFVSATATDPNGNTSEFAQNVTVGAGASPAGAVTTARVARPGVALASPATTGTASSNAALGSLTDAALNDLAGTLTRPNQRGLRRDQLIAGRRSSPGAASAIIHGSTARPTSSSQYLPDAGDDPCGRRGGETANPGRRTSADAPCRPAVGPGDATRRSGGCHRDEGRSRRPGPRAGPWACRSDRPPRRPRAGPSGGCPRGAGQADGARRSDEVPGHHRPADGASGARPTDVSDRLPATLPAPPVAGSRNRPLVEGGSARHLRWVVWAV